MNSQEIALAVPETATRKAETTDPRMWGWVETSVWTERMLTALGNGVKGGKWYSLMDKVLAQRTLWAAWQQVAANQGAAGVDRVSVERFKQNEIHLLRELGKSLRDGTFRPEAIRRVYIPKGKGKTRPLGIPTVKDRVVQTALKMVLEPIFEREFLSSSFGFRPGRGCKDALRRVDALIKAGYTWVVDADLKSYFDSIPHDILMERVEAKISDGRILSLIESFLQQDVLEDMKRWTPMKGSPQGAVISPLLANVFLHPLDALIQEAGFEIVRYADDFVILCRSEAEAQEALGLVESWTSANGLTLHPDKTHLGNCLEGGFEFLGYRFRAGQTIRALEEPDGSS